MPRKIVLSITAQDNLEDQFFFIAQDSPQNAERVKERVYAAIEELAEMPIGRPGRVPNIYEKSVRKTSLIVAYELTNNETLTVLRVIHTSRNWQDGVWPED